MWLDVFSIIPIDRYGNTFPAHSRVCVYCMESRVNKDSPHGMLKTSLMFHLKCQDSAFSLSLSLL